MFAKLVVHLCLSSLLLFHLHALLSKSGLDGELLVDDPFLQSAHFLPDHVVNLRLRCELLYYLLPVTCEVIKGRSDTISGPLCHSCNLRGG